MTPALTIATARPADWAAIVGLLEHARLPHDDAADHLADFLVAREGETIVGVAGFERHGRFGLLRSVAVRPANHGQGIGTRLVNACIARAQTSGVLLLGLLTTTAADWFLRFGFSPIDRNALPEPLRASREWQQLCPASATCLQLTLHRIEIRPAIEADLPAIVDIYNDVVLTSTASFEEQPRSLAGQHAWYAAIREQRLPVFVATVEGIVVGWASLGSFRPRPAYRYTLECSLHLDARHRGQGIGALLMQALVSAARAGGYHSIIAVIDADNRPSLQLHRHFGFAEAGRFREIGYKFERWLDLAFMQKLL